VTVAPAPGAQPDYLPLWCARGLLVCAVAVLSYGGIGLTLALAGHYDVVPSALGAAPLTAILSALAWPRGSESRNPADRSAAVVLPAVGICLVALGSAVWNGKVNGHFVEVDRDPGVYAVAGRWLDGHDSLRVPAGLDWAGKATNVDWASIGMYGEPDGHVEFQFQHMLPVLLAAGHSVGGDRLMFAVPGILGALGILCVYAAGCRLVRKPWLVLAAATGLAVSLPQLSVSRDTFSETLAQSMLWAGMWLSLVAYQRFRVGTALVAGLALGASTMARVDALVYLAALPMLAAAAFLAEASVVNRRRLLRVFGAGLLGLIPPTVLASVDLEVFTSGYYRDLKTEVTALRALFVVALLGGLLLVGMWPRLGSMREFAKARRATWGTRLGFAAGAGMLLIWSLRPAFDRPLLRHPNLTVVGYQKALGLPIEPRRSYGEHSLTWFAWYLGGATILLAIVGLGILVRRVITGRDPAGLLILALAGPATALYLWNPSNTPEQIWVVRRFVPAGFPLVVLLAVLAVTVVASLVAKSRNARTSERAVAAVGAMVLVLFPLGATWPVRNFESQAGYISLVDKTCSTMGPNAAVLFPATDRLGDTLMQTLRSYCGVPAGQLVDPWSPDDVGKLSALWRASGKTLWIVGSDVDSMKATAPSLSPGLVGSATNNSMLEQTLLQPPSRYTSEALTVYAVPVPAG